AQCAWAKLSGMQRTVIAAKTQDGQTICATFDRCDIDPHLPTCARLARVPIERRWITPLGPLLAGGERPVRRRRQAASPCRGAEEFGEAGRGGGGRSEGQERNCTRDDDVFGRADTSRFSLYCDRLGRGVRGRRDARAADCTDESRRLDDCGGRADRGRSYA